ncbi:polysaccharide biosynthesis protein [Algirhabdus cladophorae]|uniref:polysaccharide biosynthesis protein n=1 Tax=Algirhabdus cladophorae TaxID=3377108 RepID=UPI003B847155
MLKFIQSLTRLQKGALLLIADMAIVPLALIAAVFLQNEMAAYQTNIQNTASLNVGLIIVAMVLSLQLGIPKIRLNAFHSDYLGKLGLFSFLMILLGLGLEQLMDIGLSTGAYIFFGMTNFFIASAFRLVLLQIVLVIYRSARPRCRVLIYGAGNTGVQLANALKTHDSIDPIAFVDDNPALSRQTVTGLQVYSPVRIEELIEKLKIERVLLAMPSVSKPKQTQIVRPLQKMGIDVQSLPSFSQLVGTEALVDQLAPMVATDILGSERVSPNRPQKMDYYENEHILVTGAGGSIGSEICRQIIHSRPKRLVMFDISEFALYQVERELRPLAEDFGIELSAVLGSVREARVVERVLKTHEIGVILHAAAYKHVPIVEQNQMVGLSNNVLGTATLARAARAAGVKRFLLISSDKAVRPTNIMGASKRMAEQVIQDMADKSADGVFSMVRFGNVLGSSGSVIPLFQDQISRGGPVTLTHPDVTRYFMTIDEAVHLVLQSGAIARGGEVFVLDMGEPIKIRNLAEKVIAASGYSLRNRNNPDGDIEIKVTGLRDGEKLHEELLIDEGVLTTSHKKIFSAREGKLSEIEVAAMLKDLQDAVDTDSLEGAVAVAHRCVEGFGPKPKSQPALQSS